MVKHYKLINFKIPLLNQLGLRLGFTLFAGLVKPMRKSISSMGSFRQVVFYAISRYMKGFNNTCKYCPSDKQIVFWDFRQTSIDKAYTALIDIQNRYPILTDIFLFGNEPDNNSYRAISPIKLGINLNKDIVMQTKQIDRAFSRLYISGLNRKTIRLTPKENKSVVYIVNISKKQNRLNAMFYSYPHMFWLNQLFHSPIIEPNDGHDISGLTNVDYETTNW